MSSELSQDVLCGDCYRLIREIASQEIPSSEEKYEAPRLVHHETGTSFTQAIADGCLICIRLFSARTGSRGLGYGPTWLEGAPKLPYGFADASRDETTDFRKSLDLSFYERDDDDEYLILDSFWLVPAPTDRQTNPSLWEPQITLSCSADNLDLIRIARDWIDRCSTSHKYCTRKRSAEEELWTPTRLISVSRNGDFCLREGSELPPKAEYLTLSHCWGKLDKRTVLTQSNLESWKTPSSSENLPKTIRDAIEATRSLGFTYIWIDQLCIIQDSDLDWRHEARLMSRVYKYSTCNLMACEAENSDSGFYKERDQATHIPKRFDCGKVICRTGAHTAQQEPLPSKSLRGSYEIRKDMAFERGVDDSYTYNRAWVVQERVMASRAIYFTQNEVFWECSHLRASNFAPKGLWPDLGFVLGKGTTDPFLIVEETAERSEGISTLQRKALRSWRYLSRKYCGAALTFESDALVAISAVARELKPLIDSPYHAGIWERDALRQLNWHIHGPNPKFTYQAPSFSWASRQGAYCVRHTLSPRHSWELAEVLSFHTDLVDDNDEFGQVRNGDMVIKGQLFEFKPDKEGQESATEDGPLNGPILKINLNGYIVEAERYVDEAWSVGSTFCIPLFLVEDSNADFGSFTYVRALVMQEAKGENAYRRIGMLGIHVSTADKFVQGGEWAKQHVGKLSLNDEAVVTLEEQYRSNWQSIKIV